MKQQVREGSAKVKPEILPKKHAEPAPRQYGVFPPLIKGGPLVADRLESSALSVSGEPGSGGYGFGRQHVANTMKGFYDVFDIVRWR